MKLLVLLEELEVGTTANQGVYEKLVSASESNPSYTVLSRSELTLRFDLILNHQSLALVVNLLGELGGDSVVSSRVLHDETLVALHSVENGCFFDSPVTDIGPVFVRLGVVLFSVGRSPSGFPALSELFEERCLQVGRLICKLAGVGVVGRTRLAQHTVKVGFSATEDTSGCFSASSAWA